MFLILQKKKYILQSNVLHIFVSLSIVQKQTWLSVVRYKCIAILVIHISLIVFEN